MPNVGGPKQRRLLLSSVVTSVLTYGISIWADALETQDSWRKAGPIYRMSALRVASAFRTVSEEAVIEERQKSIARWQRQWDAAEKGRWTHYLIPRIDVWLNRVTVEIIKNIYFEGLQLPTSMLRTVFLEVMSFGEVSLEEEGIVLLDQCSHYCRTKAYRKKTPVVDANTDLEISSEDEDPTYSVHLNSNPVNLDQKMRVKLHKVPTS
ncbi:hypothetical protein EVAR_88237_1 [Eumeta japonica]|uniref:Uncharacterized protein n=1 Tax=Eumeta variegata TaxID=151549 RepID=A0A4C1Z2Q3_EUMVA|nr:hypothetical protein EVAR_88237_1 [Eumeta japonica]